MLRRAQQSIKKPIAAVSGKIFHFGKADLGKVDEVLSTLGSGQGVMVFFGMANPVKTPQIGAAHAP